MATPISEQIAAKVRTRLQSITVANGYELSVSEVVRPVRFDGWRPQNNQLIVTQGNLSKNEELSVPGNPPATAYDLEFTIAGLLMPTESSTSKIDTLRNTFASDTIKAICTPAASWHNWDTLAIDTKVGDVTDITTEESSGFKLSLTVTFRTTENNPYQSRT
jgi:hypothetical protein